MAESNWVNPTREQWRQVAVVGERPDKPNGAGSWEARWPAPLGEAALIGPTGDFARRAEPNTEADPAALVLQFLVATGNFLGRHGHFRVEADFHYPNLFAGIVGRTSRGRKGTSWGHVRELVKAADPKWAEDRVSSGLATGEGLIFHVRDAGADEAGSGIEDKRLLVVESELALVLKKMNRDGNTLSDTMRSAWDGGTLRTLTRHSPLKATDAHVSVIAHITEEELRRELTSVEVANGFANRFLWVCAKRMRPLPRGGNRYQAGDIVQGLHEARIHAQTVGCLDFDDEALSLWEAFYLQQFREPGFGLVGAVTARAEAQTRRLALIYALLDLSTEIRREHLEAAIEVWRYCAESARHIFGDATGDPLADRILELLRDAPEGLSRTDLHERLGKHTRGKSLGARLESLRSGGFARCERRETAGRSAEVWYAT